MCGGRTFSSRPVLWDELVGEWQLSPAERAYVDRQQGTVCVECGNNLRSIALANALRQAVGTAATLEAFVAAPEASTLLMLEINEAGTLSPVLRRLPGHTLGAYPAIDMHQLPYAEGSFDIVIHSDTLEHVNNPVRALSECRRVLRPNGWLCFTIPTILGRLTRSREGLEKSYHGDATMRNDDFVVHTEFGADMWTYVIAAGFEELTIHTVSYPDATALSARR